MALGVAAYFLQPVFQSFSLQIVLWQRELHRALTLGFSDWATLLTISFAYGVFHAAGPGHGKAVIATYLASHDSTSRRTAVWMSAASSLVQGLSAIMLVTILILGLGWVTRQAMGSVYWVEQASFTMVTLLGGWLCWRAIKRLRQPDRHHCCDGHAHSSPETAPNDWRSAAGVIFSVGIRPCSGAVLMLGAGLLLGQFALGVAGVLVMSLGTALTVSALAILSVYAREWAQRWAVSSDNTQHPVGGWIALIGGLVIMLLGISLLIASGSQPITSPLLNTPPLRGL
ncbi:MAG: nickel/cobalt transporter [Gammaproteobacteria bacterium]|nr:nickel/cobalt transporter [Gammaproteobacteria bacterium]